MQHQFDTTDAFLILFQFVIVGVRFVVVFPCLAQSAFLGVTDLFMGQVVTDELVHETGNRTPVIVVRAGFHRSTDDVVAPPSECPEYVADMPVMVLVTEETGLPLVFLPVCLPRVILVPLGVALGVPLGNLEYGILFTDPCKT